MRLPIGSEVACSDGVAGDLVAVVLDPLSRAVTHLVVEPSHRSGLGRLVPIELAEVRGQETRLRCSREELAALPHAEETELLPGSAPGLGYGPGQFYAWPYYGVGVGVGAGAGTGIGNLQRPVVRDRVPLGEVALRRGDEVQATDGPIGRVEGLVVDAADRHV
ncbi:MAG: hypothetical protein ACRDYD_01970, partial [Acidimicrobiales bacterium]